MNKHAFLSASGAPAWSRCEAKPWREKGLPEQTSVFAAEGTKAHELLERCLTEKVDLTAVGFSDDMYNNVQKTLDYIEAQEFEQLYAEQRLDISFITGEEDAQGTADVIGIKGNVITVIDFKFGLGVRVEAEGNEQLMIYGAAALKEFDLVGDITTIKLVISQPRLNHTSEHLLTIVQLSRMIETLATKAKRILTAKGGDLSATPGNTQCKFCRAKANCREYRHYTALTITNNENVFDKDDYLDKIKDAETQLTLVDDEKLANCMDAVALIKNWCTGVEREVENRLQNDNFSDHRWKLVQGKPGNRKIADAEELIEIAEEHGITENELYEKQLISPAQLEKIHKKDHPVFWAKVQLLMSRPDGKPVVVPGDDKRPALNLALDFKPIEDDYINAAIGLTIEGPP